MLLLINACFSLFIRPWPVFHLHKDTIAFLQQQVFQTSCFVLLFFLFVCFANIVGNKELTYSMCIPSLII